jgi:hypothetical protein
METENCFIQQGLVRDLHETKNVKPATPACRRAGKYAENHRITYMVKDKSNQPPNNNGTTQKKPRTPSFFTTNYTN